MSYQIEVLDNPTDFSAAVEATAQGARNELILGRWEGGLLEFAGIAFPGVDQTNIFAKRHERESTGREPHFDYYRGFVDERTPWIAHYNLSGKATIVTTELPEDLATAYVRRYRDQTEEAARARRHFSRIALEEPGAKIGVGVIDSGDRLIIPVRPNGPHIVHDIKPLYPVNPGAYVKMIAASHSTEAREDLRSSEYLPLDVFLTNSLGAETQRRRVTTPPPPQADISRQPYRAAHRRCVGLD